ncbi:MAG: Na+/H+ antiporter NhaA [Bacteroidota bacterium]
MKKNKKPVSIHNYVLDPIRDLSESGRLTGILLITATLLSILLSNSEYAANYIHLWQQKIGFSFLNKTLEHWINDGLMVLFFFLVGIEIKREMLVGELSNPKQALLPIFAAFGGIIVPALIFFLFNKESAENIRGWAIPTATDIAFSLGIITLLGKRVPVSLKIFLTALAIIDDLAAILIIAVFYTSELQAEMLLYAGLFILVMFALNRFRNRFLILYILTGVCLWYCILKSGIHPTIAGVITAFLIPRELTGHVEHALLKPVNYFILPLFAMANMAIPLSFEGSWTALFSPLTAGIILGLLVGKPVGIFFMSLLAVRFRIAELPAQSNRKQLLGTGILAGIGFTMSIFIASLSFHTDLTLNLAKLAIIGGSVFAAVIGMIVLWFAEDRR